MIIDFHTHTFPDDVAERALAKLQKSTHLPVYSDGTAEGLRKTSAEAGIGLSVILPVATAARQVEHINDRAIRRNEAEGSAVGRTEETACRLLSFGCMHPEYEHYREELRRIAQSGVPGIKLHPYFHGCDMDDIRYLRILDAAAENGLIVVTHAGYDQGFPGQHNCSVPMLRKVLQQVNGITMVAAHMGSWKEWEEVPELLADTGVYLDTCFSVGSLEAAEGEDAYWEVGHREADPGMTSLAEQTAAERAAGGTEKNAVRPWEEYRETAKSRSVFGDLRLLDPDEFAKIVRAFPADHVLFATDSPWSSAKKAVSFVQNAPLSEEEKESILGGAAEKLLAEHR